MSVDWQPKETAPKDGSPFLGFIDWGSAANDEILRVCWSDIFEKFVDATYDPFHEAADNMTHWMPLPAPPQKQE